MLSWSVCDPWMSEWSRHCKSTGLTKKYPRNEANWIAYTVSALKSLHARRQHYKPSGSQVRSLNLQGDRGWLRHEQVTGTDVEAPKIFIPEWTVSRDDLSQLYWRSAENQIRGPQWQYLRKFKHVALAPNWRSAALIIAFVKFALRGKEYIPGK